jgi:hypothetical protein
VFRSYVPNPWPVYTAALLLGLLAVTLFLLNRRRADPAFSLGVIPGFPLITLVTVLFCRPYAEPWVTCKHISDMLERTDHSGTVVLTSKFYVRGVRYFTDRKMAVIDINGKGFFSPHPIPFLNSDAKVLAFLRSQPFTFAILKEGDLKHLVSLAERDHFTLTPLGGDGGKELVKIVPLRS